jgi:hypothetical protein
VHATDAERAQIIWEARMENQLKQNEEKLSSAAYTILILIKFKLKI